jgi:diguanylate cyclase (GGDEF)-like protein
MLAIEWQRAARSGGSLSLLMVDIDHFKRYNDHYGHVAGDECLRRVTHVLASCVRRAGELLARYGGEEFVLLLPGADLAHARDLAQRCLNAVHRENIPHGSSPTADHITVSIGVAQVYPAGAKDPESLVNAADTAMYRAKMDGRARYEVAGQADWDIDKDAPRSHAGQLG